MILLYFKNLPLLHMFDNPWIVVVFPCTDKLAMSRVCSEVTIEIQQQVVQKQHEQERVDCDRTIQGLTS